MLAQQIRRKFSVEEYIALFRLAVVENAKTELIDGEIVELSPLGFRHAKTQQLMWRFLASRYGGDDVYQSGSIIVDDSNMLEPDVFVLGPDAHIKDNYPTADQLLLVVEVADSTIATDLLNDGTGKLASYAKSGTPIVWVVDVTAGSIYEFSDPKHSIYQTCKIHVGPTEMLGESVNVSNLIG